MIGFLAYQFPGKEKVISIGSWKKTTMLDIPEDHFFISDFQKERCFYFHPENTSINENLVEFFTNTIDDVFVANRNSYLNGLNVFIHEFEPRGIEKAVFSRINAVPIQQNKTPLEIFHALADTYKDHALVYLISDAQFGTWIGATPETLLHGGESGIRSMALAGTKEDDKQAWTEKEYHEQELVTQYVEGIIQAQQPLSYQKSEVETVKNGAVYHLRTNFEFLLPAGKWNGLMDELHPTPAVCGTPKEKALSLILDFEPHDREFYTGLIGMKGSTKLEVFVNLRCMQLLRDYYALYVGGGITQQSDLAAEWIETELKSQTLLRVLQD